MPCFSYLLAHFKKYSNGQNSITSKVNKKLQFILDKRLKGKSLNPHLWMFKKKLYKPKINFLKINK